MIITNVSNKTRVLEQQSNRILYSVYRIVYIV